MHKRKRDWPVKVYQYGLMTNEDIPDSWLQEHTKWVNTWNTLVDKFQELRSEYQAIFDADQKIKDMKDEIRLLVDKRKELKTIIKKDRVKLRSAKKDNSGYRQEIKQISAIIKTKWEEIKTLKASFQENNQDKIKEHKGKTIILVDQMINDSGMYWTHKNYLPECWWLAVKKSHGVPHKKDIFGKDICFMHRYTGGGKSLSTILKPNKRFWIEPVDWNKVDMTLPQNQWKKLTRTKVHFWMCGEEKIFSCVLHRPIPENIIVKQIRLTMKRYGTDTRAPKARTCKTTRWEMNIFVDIPHESVEKRIGFANQGKMVFELGWRRIDDNLRVGVYRDESGKFRQIILPEKITSSIQASRELQQKKDEQLNKLRELLKDKINIQSGVSKYFEMADNLDGGFKDKVKDLLNHWKWYSYLIKTTHRKASIQRRKWYYDLAHELFRNNHTIIMKKIDIKKLGQPKKDKERGKVLTEAQKLAQKYRALAAIGELRSVLKAVAVKYDAQVIEVPGENTSLKHFECSHIQVDLSPEERQQLYIKCQKCGKRYDQDENSIENMSRQYLENLQGFSTENGFSENKEIIDIKAIEI